MMMETLPFAYTYTRLLPSFDPARLMLFEGNSSLGTDFSSDSHKELPTKLNRQRRSTERRDLSQALNFDENHRPTPPTQIPTTTTCTTGTQTVLVGVRLEDSELVGIPQVNPALPTDSSSALSSPSIINQPTGIFGVVRHHQLRPSVITCAPPPTQRESTQTIARTSPFRPNGYTSAQTNSTFRREITSSGFCDPVIEEHFRRSLGENYKETLPKSPDVPTDNEHKEVSITGSVDDHFAKALGDQWTNIKKTVQDSQKKATPPSSPAPSSPVAPQSSSPVPNGITAPRN
ncbi:uncharacterized protein [Amphiura filiformis]|uniref:uncharacterized protein isoform X2 n=1 Tax=Amphiura filiformis TaxID=82378 RepID=UPI003B20B7B6